MDAPPPKLTAEAFDQFIADHIATHYEKTADGYRCRKCGSVIMQTTGAASVHNLDSERCAGYGRVKLIPLPYCPQCEGVPTRRSTCIHEE